MASPALWLTLRVNGETHSLPALDPRTTLLDALRERLKLTGTKKGCDLGQCGACTVLADGRRIKACLALAALYEDQEITTIEGVRPRTASTAPAPARPSSSTTRFSAATARRGRSCRRSGCWSEGRAGSVAEIREFMSGNLCRCGAYANIVAAIAEVAQTPVERVTTSPAPERP